MPPDLPRGSLSALCIILFCLSRPLLPTVSFHPCYVSMRKAGHINCCYAVLIQLQKPRLSEGSKSREVIWLDVREWGGRCPSKRTPWWAHHHWKMKHRLGTSADPWGRQRCADAWFKEGAVGLQLQRAHIHPGSHFFKHQVPCEHRAYAWFSARTGGGGQIVRCYHLCH